MDFNIGGSGSVSPYANNGYTEPNSNTLGGGGSTGGTTDNTSAPSSSVGWESLVDPKSSAGFYLKYGYIPISPVDPTASTRMLEEAKAQIAGYQERQTQLNSELASSQNVAHANDFVGVATPGAIVKPPPTAGLMQPPPETPAPLIPPNLPQPETPLGIRPVPAMGGDWNVKFKPDLSGLVGLLFPPKAPGQYTPTTAPTFTGLMTPKQDTQPLKGESQSFLPWQRQSSLTPANADTSYLKDYRKDNFSLSKGYEAQNEGLMLPTLDSYSLAKGQAAVPTLDIDKQPEEKATGNYLKDYMKSNRDNLTKGVWQAYA